MNSLAAYRGAQIQSSLVVTPWEKPFSFYSVSVKIQYQSGASQSIKHPCRSRENWMETAKKIAVQEIDKRLAMEEQADRIIANNCLNCQYDSPNTVPRCAVNPYTTINCSDWKEVTE